MRARLDVMSAVAIIVASLGAACGDSRSAPAAPSAAPAPAQPAPAPTAPTPRLSSEVAGVWNLSLRITETTGVGCVADAFRAGSAEPDAYSLSVQDTGQVTISSRSDALSCSFTAVADGDSGFTTYGVPGFYTCVGEPRTYKCADGTEHRYFSFGQDIGGKVSGGRISGTWLVFWVKVGNDSQFVEAKAQFSGTR